MDAGYQFSEGLIFTDSIVKHSSHCNLNMTTWVVITLIITSKGSSKVQKRVSRNAHLQAKGHQLN